MLIFSLEYFSFCIDRLCIAYGEWAAELHLMTYFTFMDTKAKEHIKTRANIRELAEYIVPGHGPMFQVDKSVDILSIEKVDILLKTTSNV